MNNEKLARAIALGHGGKQVLRREGQTETVASLAGYGLFAHSLDAYVEEKWQQYDGAAEMAHDVVVNDCADLCEAAHTVELVMRDNASCSGARICHGDRANALREMAKIIRSKLGRYFGRSHAPL